MKITALTRRKDIPTILKHDGRRVVSAKHNPKMLLRKVLLIAEFVVASVMFGFAIYAIYRFIKTLTPLYY